MTTHHFLIAGAGIGGLAAALALKHGGAHVTVLEAAAELGEVGAGIQLGPNAMKVLAKLGLHDAVMQVASVPEAIVIADAATGRPISRMLLGQAVQHKYGVPYVSLHRADLHGVLLHAAQTAGVQIEVNQALLNYEHTTQEIRRRSADFDQKYDALIGADGLWSAVRAQLLNDGAPRATGHAAFRALIPCEQMPQALRTPHVRTWWARDVHVVSYPLRGGALWNLVVLAETPDSETAGWSLAATDAQVMQCFGRVEPQLLSLLQAGSRAGWRRWNLFDREPFAAKCMAQGRVALLGDAAHPMLPYMAQGAGMALEDAWQLACSVRQHMHIVQALAHYAHARAARNARVVRSAQRNGRIFHLSGAMALARNAVLTLQGTQVLGMPWLYGYSVSESLGQNPMN
ncbi:MAG: FAD-dependent monooxygenase [Brachymonas sp.]